MKFAYIFLTIANLTIIPSLFADDHTATITRYFGQVKILTDPQKSVKGNGPHVLYEDQYYTSKKPEVGMTLGLGTVIQTGKVSRVRLIFPNGDQFSVAANTYYQISKEKKEDKAPLVKLFFGAIRSTIHKDGPRNGLKVKTKTVSMGVRGTDFYIATATSKKPTTVSILRGKVEVKTPHQKKPVVVKGGFTAEVPSTKGGQKKIVAPRKTSRKNIVEIQKKTRIKKNKSSTKKLDPKVQKKIQALEKQAVKTTLSDIKTHDPKLYKKIVKKKPENLSIDHVQTMAAEDAYKAAPPIDTNQETPKFKPSEEQLDVTEDEIYEKYFDVD